MRVAMVVTAPTRGGVYTFVKDLTISLSQRSHFVDLYVGDVLRPDFEGDVGHLSGVTIHGLGQAATADCDVWHLHLHDSFCRTALLLQLKRVATRGTRTIVLDEHLPRTPRSDSLLEYEPDTPPGRKKPFAKQLKTLLKRTQFALSKKVLVHSKASGTFLHSRYGTAEDRLTLVPIGVPRTEALEPPPASNVLKILLLAVVCFRKGHDLLIEATRYATTPWEVTFVGGGGQIDAFRELAARRAKQPVIFAGPQNDPRAAVMACDVVCVPSRADASSISGLEAMMAGKPLVVSQADGVPELVDDGVTGFVVDALNPAELARALDLLADRERRLEMGSAARRAMLASKTFDHMTDQIQSIYEEIR